MKDNTTNHIGEVKTALLSQNYFDFYTFKIRIYNNIFNDEYSNSLTNKEYKECIKSDQELTRILSAIFVNENSFYYLEVVNGTYLLTSHKDNYENKWVLHGAYKNDFEIYRNAFESEIPGYVSNKVLFYLIQYLNSIYYVSLPISFEMLERVKGYND